jgi:hypothetical protein
VTEKQMTVKILREKLAGLDDEMRISVGPVDDGFAHAVDAQTQGLPNSKDGALRPATWTEALPSSDGKILVIQYSKLR